jgi:hypothetical protein
MQIGTRTEILCFCQLGRSQTAPLDADSRIMTQTIADRRVHVRTKEELTGVIRGQISKWIERNLANRP